MRYLVMGSLCGAVLAASIPAPTSVLADYREIRCIALNIETYGCPNPASPQSNSRERRLGGNPPDRVIVVVGVKPPPPPPPTEEPEVPELPELPTVETQRTMLASVPPKGFHAKKVNSTIGGNVSATSGGNRKTK